MYTLANDNPRAGDQSVRHADLPVVCLSMRDCNIRILPSRARSEYVRPASIPFRLSAAWAAR